MSTRRTLQILLVGVSLLAAACAGAPNLAPPPYTASPPSCPYDRVIQFNGDSVASAWAAATSIPDHEVFNAAQGAAGHVFDALPTIGDRVREWIELCGAPSAVVISGGGNDFGHGEYVSSVENATAELGAWLAARDIPAVWVTIYPFPETSPAHALFDPQRRAYNDWLRAGGPGWGVIADVGPPMGGDTLAPQFWTWATATVPDVHPNAAGYAAGAAVIEASLSELLAEPPA